ncbi:MAG: hypothetical protein L3J35_09865 [Bacteroidales bacterium]|nr:hypothetical protein [Bacteroidales bacterium]
MTNEYYCPHCKAQLKVGNRIILTAKVDKYKGGLILFEPKLGDFKIVKHKSCKIEENTHVDFLCPVCHENLSTAQENLAEILLVDSDGDEYGIMFSEILGEQATFKIKAGKVYDAFGNDQNKYINHFGKGPEY